MYAFLCLLTILLSFSNKIFATPKSGTVVAGQASISQQAKKTTVQQTTNKAIVNWQNFNVGSDEWVAFMQPGSSSITLNRVLGGNRSDIFGKITAPGQVWLINRAGIFFGKNAYIDVAGLIATTADINSNDFMAGRYFFTQPQGYDTSKIIHQGEIAAGKPLNGTTVKQNGLVVFVAPGVENSGLIQANLGKVTLAAVGGGEQFTIDLFGDNLITYVFSPNVVSPSYSVKNTGEIIANGGKVVLTAGAAKDIVDSVVSNTGVIEANAIGHHKGEIVLYSGEHGLTKVTGQLKASGGRVKVLGNKVEVAKENPAVIDVSAKGGGGEVLVGNNGTMTTYVGSHGKIFANAVLEGDGGSIIIWSDNNTYVFGTLEAIGDSGGFIETSGKNLDIGRAQVTASGLNGAPGTWLIDPITMEVIAVGPVGLNQILAATIVADLEGNISYEVRADNLITVSAEIRTSLNPLNTILTLESGGGVGGNININAPIIGGFKLEIDAAGTITPLAAINVYDFTLQAGIWNQVVSPLPNFNVANDFQIASGATFKRFADGSGVFGDPYEISDIYGLQGVVPLSHYKLINDIEAARTQKWNSPYGFKPITFFGARLNGNQYAIKNLYINRSSEDNVGLVGFLDVGGEIKGVGLVNPTIIGRNNVGTLAGKVVGGKIEESWSIGGKVTGNNNVGGLAGWVENAASPGKALISNSFSTTEVSANNNVGGLVGYLLHKAFLTPTKIENSYAAGKVTGVNLTGGLVGKNQGGTVTNSFWDIETSGQSTSAGGTGKNTADMLKKSTFANAGWGPAWKIIEGKSYPYLGSIIPLPPGAAELPADATPENILPPEEEPAALPPLLAMLKYLAQAFVTFQDFLQLNYEELSAAGFTDDQIELMFKAVWELSQEVSYNDLITAVASDNVFNILDKASKETKNALINMYLALSGKTQKQNKLIEFFTSLPDNFDLELIYNMNRNLSWDDLKPMIISPPPPPVTYSVTLIEPVTADPGTEIEPVTADPGTEIEAVTRDPGTQPDVRTTEPDTRGPGTQPDVRITEPDTRGPGTQTDVRITEPDTRGPGTQPDVRTTAPTSGP